MRDGQTDRFVTVDERIFISLDGTLHFSFVKPEDATSYACTLAPRWARAGFYSPFANLILSTHTKFSPFAPRIDEYHPLVHPALPLVDHVVQIECLAYASPLATYKWERVDGTLSARHHVESFGRVLRISPVRAADAALYRCTASNEHGETSAEIRLVVKCESAIERSATSMQAAVVVCSAADYRSRTQRHARVDQLDCATRMSDQRSERRRRVVQRHESDNAASFARRRSSSISARTQRALNRAPTSVGRRCLPMSSVQ